MNEEILSGIHNKLTAPKIALEKLAKGERVPKEFLELAAEELKAAGNLLRKLTTSGDNTAEPKLINRGVR